MRREETVFNEQDPTSPQSRLLKHRKNHARVNRAIRSIYAGAAVALGENLTLGILQVIYIMRVGSLGTMATLSLVTSACQFGAKVSKLILLKDYFPYRSKEAKKVKNLQTIVNGEGTKLNTVLRGAVLLETS